jgi:GDPmannose 4,6-dehydratase
VGKVALITGISGQDGSYLSELLLSKGYKVHGVIRRSSVINTERIDHIFDPEDRTYIHYGDLEEGLEQLLFDIQPDEIYNLAAMSQVRISFDIPVYTAMVNAVGVVKLLETIRKLRLKCKLYQASSSEMFGTTPPPQNENSPFNPVSPYGCAKLYSYYMVKAYRTGYGMFVSNGILFNHESERRGHNFVSKKIIKGAVRIKKGLQDKLYLGNLDALRDWGHSKDYVRAMHLILQQDKPDDFVVATGENHTVKEFVETVFTLLNLDWHKFVVQTDVLNRPNEVPALLGDSSKIRKLGWKPEIDFDSLIEGMVDYEFNTYSH